MANDVKALPVVAWLTFRPGVGWTPSPVAGCGGVTSNAPLVRQSDAESALAELRQRADTAEARLERARGLLRECAEQMGNCCPTCSEDRIAEITAFLGD